MKVLGKIAGLGLLGIFAAGFGAAPSVAQTPIPVAPVVLGAPIVIGAIAPKSKTTGLGKFEGYVQNANIAQITVRARNNETSLQTFTLSQAASQKMQTIVDRGGYQYGDRVTIYYDPQTKQAIKIKGKPSKAI
jgi:hypothetical protein